MSGARLVLAACIVFGAAGCNEESAAPSHSAAPTNSVGRLEATIERALDWADTLDVHPVRVRDELDMKGTKHFAELLDLLYSVYRWQPESPLGRRAHARAREILAAVDEDAYHDLGSIESVRFRQDSMPYLWACVLAERFGKDTTRYRHEIQKVLPRIHESLPKRAVHVRMGFALLFAQLGLPQPETLASIFPESLIARQVPLTYYRAGPARPYHLTHEIFAMTQRGTRPFPFRTPEEEHYTLATVRELLELSMQQPNLDLAAELLVDLAYLGEGRSELASKARDFLYRGQNPDGSFARYDPERARRIKKNPTFDVRIGAVLHTTSVCIWSLVETTPGAAD